MKEGGIKRERMKWMATIDDALVLALRNQHNAGNHVEGTFSPLAYSNIIKELKSTIVHFVIVTFLRVLFCYDVQSNKKRKVSNDEEFDVLKGALHTVAKAIREGNFVIEQSRPHVYSEKDIFNQFVVIGIASKITDDCYIYLTENAAKTRAFFGCPSERRKSILMKLMELSKQA
ncbi:hypothetical protein M9H77_18199 [Catharanthus roseus]|uniref:Uncharacterized protein n=1 Tax=Catharanthus roseus TaxID=4058 RepID=A0ACC0B6S9_CATRO|nr:hypothetical protein M9H77_18199 [Catharanthus roseus]